MSTFRLEIVTPTRVIDKGEVNYVRCPGSDGQFGVMARHTNAMFALVEGEIKVVTDKETSYLATRGGFAEVTGKEVKILVETAEHTAEIDLDRAQTALERAKQRFTEKGPDMDLARAELSIKRALTRLRVAKRHQI